MPTPNRLRPAPFIAGLAGASTISLIGVWLVVAPFAVGYQPDGAEWADATIVGVASGAAVILLGLLTLLVAFGALRAEVRHRGLAPSVRAEPAEGDRSCSGAADEDVEDVEDKQSQPVPTADLDTILASLATALLDDLRNGQTDPESATPAPHTTAPPAVHRPIT